MLYDLAIPNRDLRFVLAQVNLTVRLLNRTLIQHGLINMKMVFGVDRLFTQRQSGHICYSL